MFNIEKTDYGIKLIFSGFIKKDEMSNWVNESEKFLLTCPPQFSVFVDMRELKPLPEDSQHEMEKGQKMYKLKGMIRSVVIVNSTLTAMQFKRIAKETGIYEWERYIDAATTVKDWEDMGKKWLVSAIDPDK